MDEVDFMENNEFHIKSRKLLGEPQTPTMIRLLLKSGLVKTEKQALIVVSIFICVMFVATWFILAGVGGNGSGYVEGPDGRKYSAEEYIKMVDSGNDPLSPAKIKEYRR